MEIIQLNCTSCGAPITVADGVESVTCPYCHSNLYVQKSQGQVVLSLSQQLSNSITQGSETTQIELKRLQLGQEISMLQLQLSTLQSEIRTLERQPSTALITRQLGDLKDQERNILSRINVLQEALAPGDSNASNYALLTSKKPKNWLIAYLLCFFLGFFGAHQFYAGNILAGVLQLFSFGGFLIWWVIDLFLIATGKFKDSRQVTLNGPMSTTGRLIAIGCSVFWVILLFAAIANRP